MFLPSRGGESRRLFYARVRGAAEPTAFEASRDRLELRPAAELPFLQALIDSGFRPTHWLVRQDAAHAKSKTYNR